MSFIFCGLCSLIAVSLPLIIKGMFFL
jgi:hypothetical protein